MKQRSDPKFPFEVVNLSKILDKNRKRKPIFRNPADSLRMQELEDVIFYLGFKTVPH